MNKKECELIGRAFAQEYYKLCCEKGIPQSDLVSADEACKILGRSKGWLYNHRHELPHSNRRYSRSAIEAYMNR